MAILNIPVFDGGLVTHADPEDIKHTSATTSINFETDVPGKLIKRQGRGNPSTLTANHVGQIVKWTHEDLDDPIWVYFETQNHTISKCDGDFTNIDQIKDLSSGTPSTAVEISNFGRKLRFANGLDQKAGIYQHIDREFFFGAHVFNALHYDNGMMELPATWDIVSIEKLEGGFKQSGHYYYKFCPVFDGTQEPPMPEGYKYYEMGGDDKILKVRFHMDIGDGDFNPRITSLKVYRSWADTVVGNTEPVYYHVHTIPINTKSDHDDIIQSATVRPLDDQFWSDDIPSVEPDHWGEPYYSYYIRYNNLNYELDTSSYNPEFLTLDTGDWGGINIFNDAWKLRVGEYDPGPNTWYYEDIVDKQMGGYGGKKCIYNADWVWYSGEADGWIVYSDAENLDTVAADSAERCIKLAAALSQTSNFDIDISDGYRIVVDGDDVDIYFYDYAHTDRSLHPLGTKDKAVVNYKYSAYASGRNFVGNVRLDPDSEAEDHGDWIIFSELGQPDVLPITNYIQIKDTQGGQITGLGKHLGSLVVFMERGIYRLDVASDPRHFALIESEENLGCIAPNSIITVAGQTFFAGQDNAYVIDTGFNISPISEPIKDIYLAASNLEQSRFFYDPKKARLLCRFGDDTQNIYCFDIIKARQGESVWYQLDLGSTYGADLFAIDENLNVFSITNEE